LREEAGLLLAPADRAAYDRTVAAVRSRLDEGGFAAAYGAGRALGAERAIGEAEAAATAAAGAGATPATARANPAGLSARELEVLRLLVAGRTDREIGEALFISPRTAQGHVAHIFEKLGVSTRTAAVAAALQSGLLADRVPAG
jgi:DNA-binding CsgD family transcriptional regulator